MSPNEITPAQQSLLRLVSHLEADDIFKDIHTTLSLSVANYAAQDPESSPTVKALDSWVRMMDLMMAVHDISVEKRGR